MIDPNPKPESASKKLLSIYERLRGKGHRIPNQFGCDPKELEIFGNHYPHPLPDELIKFLSETIPMGYLDIGVFKSKPPKDLLEEQLNAVPLEGNMKHGFFGLGWWSEEDDGDGWLYDLHDGKIYSVPIYNNDEADRAAVVKRAYQAFDSLKSWVDFLEQKCRERKWLG